jgi:O-antigen ligase
MIRAAAIEAERHPWTGVGPGEFKHWMLVHGSPVQFRIGLSAIPRDPHNVLAKFAAEMGVPGLALIVLWTVAVISSPWIAWRRRASSRRHEVLPYLLGLCLYAPIYLTFLIVSEWGSLTRVRLAIGAGLFLSLLRVLPDSADVTKEAA